MSRVATPRKKTKPLASVALADDGLLVEPRRVGLSAATKKTARKAGLDSSWLRWARDDWASAIWCFRDGGNPARSRKRPTSRPGTWPDALAVLTQRPTRSRSKADRARANVSGHSVDAVEPTANSADAIGHWAP